MLTEPRLKPCERRIRKPAFGEFSHASSEFSCDNSGRVDGWMAGDGRACMCWRLHRLLLRLRVHGIPITGEGKGWSKLGRSLTLADHARFLSRILVYMYIPSFLRTAF